MAADDPTRGDAGRDAGDGGDDLPGVAVRPPLLFGGAMLAGALLERWLPITPGAPDPGTEAIGVALIFLGLAIAAAAAMQFRGAGTAVPTWQPTTALVTDKLYRLSRNPIYIGLMLLHAGIAVLGWSLWIAAALVPAVAVLRQGVVKREEAYLEAKFGDAYRDYCRRVRRWV